ncbi:MAG: (d)CMP kinase [Oscillospiraceae bacterium]|nr:(d)CMP kinase [Oscillospiraceae bacterium]
MSIQITIDGPAGAGKSTIAKKLAQKLKFRYLSSGLFYRGITLEALKYSIKPNDSDKLIFLVKNIDMHLENNRLIINGEDVQNKLNSEDINKNVSSYCLNQKVRNLVTEKIRDIANNSDIVLDGRDIGSKVLPNATLKFYLTASDYTRAKRRYEQLSKDMDIKFSTILEQIRERDEQDMNRKIDPLVVPDSAIVINSSDMSIEEVVDKMVNYLNKLGVVIYEK